MNKILVIFLLLNSLFVTNIIAGGPWTKKKNEAYIQLGYNFISSNNRLFSKMHNFIFLPYQLSDKTLDLYMEYGLTDKFTLLAYLPYKVVKTRGDYDVNNTLDDILGVSIPRVTNGGLSSLGDVSLTGKYKIYDRSNVTMAGFMDLTIPTGIESQKIRLSTGYNTWGFQPGFSIGVGELKYYGFVNLAYNIRGRRTNEYRLRLEFGYKVVRTIYVMLAVDVLQSTKKLDHLNNSFYFLYPDQQEYIASTLKLAIPWNDNWGVNLHMTIKTIAGNYVQKGPAIGGSLYWKI